MFCISGDRMCPPGKGGLPQLLTLKPVEPSGIVIQEDNTQSDELMPGDTAITEDVWGM